MLFQANLHSACMCTRSLQPHPLGVVRTANEMARFLSWKKGCVLLVVVVTLIFVVLLSRKFALSHGRTTAQLFFHHRLLNTERPTSSGVNVFSKDSERFPVAITSPISRNSTVFRRNNDLSDSVNKDKVLCNNIIMNKTSNKRHVLAWLYFEQLTMATTNLFSLMWFASKMQAHTVMPFTHKSQMFGLPRVMRQNKRIYPLSLLYDMKRLNKLTCKYNLPSLVDFQDFLNRGSRRLIIIHLMYYNTDMTRLTTIGGRKISLLKALHNHHTIECCSIKYITRIVGVLESYLKRESFLSNTKEFQVHRCFCVNASLPNEPNDLLKLTNLHNSDDFSVIFTDWRGISSSNIPKKAAQGTLKNFRMFVPSAVHTLWPHPSHTVFPISSMVRGNATKFLKRVAGAKNFIAIHFRSEKIGQAEKRIPFFTERCFIQANILRDKILSKDIELVTLYFSDYGDYGSSTCRNNCNGPKKLRALFTANKLQVTHFHPKSYKAVPDSGFVALVEQEAMASAHTLLLVGGGSFQSQLEQRFKSYNRGGVVHRLCW